MSNEKRQGGLRIETARLVLRPVDPAYAGAFAELLNDEDIAGMTTRIPYPYGLKEAETFLDGASTSDGVSLQIEDHGGRLIGGLGVDRAPDGLPEIGYWIGRQFWGRGLATEALCAILEKVPSLLGKRGLVAGHFKDNPASGRVLEKAGFLYTGVVERRFSTARRAHAETRMMVWLA